eukprot:XP_011615213.1 PREDICTED: E3 ubiquitin-protein ligase RNF185-like [Takifugu rubripes]
MAAAGPRSCSGGGPAGSAFTAAGGSGGGGGEEPSGSSNGGGVHGASERERERASFECNICLDTARDAVISMCGHLFCWPCLHQWLETRPSRQQCPVCNAGISREKVIPLYGRGSASQEDPRLKTPPRPQGQRTEPEGRGGVSERTFQGAYFLTSFENNQCIYDYWTGWFSLFRVDEQPWKNQALAPVFMKCEKEKRLQPES